jgi:4-hydroxybenzoate polyprenyltransferase
LKRLYLFKQLLLHRFTTVKEVTTEKSSRSILYRLSELLFYGNYFYGICVVANCIETSMLRHIQLNNTAFYLLMFSATVLYYNYPYARNYSTTNGNARTLWHIRNKKLIQWNQIILTVVVAGLLASFLYQNYNAVFSMAPVNWLLLLMFPFIAALYYGANFFSRQYNIRSIGWLKPFIIGLIWAGLTNVYPELFNHILSNTPFEFTLQGTMLFAKNTMFIAMLAIMFDVKDYAADSRNQLSTFVVKIGLRKTIFYILIPLPILGLATFISYAVTHNFHIVSMILVMIPFLLLIVAALSFRKRRTLMYYLTVIDGLILLKALIDMVAVSL